MCLLKFEGVRLHGGMALTKHSKLWMLYTQDGSLTNRLAVNAFDSSLEETHDLRYAITPSLQRDFFGNNKYYKNQIS